ncbi:MAG TPA: 6-bladed beta-propeller, partial [Geobacteraceae bacterium]
MIGTKVLRIAISALTMGALLAGCASGPAVKDRYFWPRLPDTPRIEWLGAYQSVRDLERSSKLMELLESEDPVYLRDPFYIVSDGAGKVYVSDMKARGVLVFDFSKGKVHILAEEYAVRPTSPTGVALDGEGNLYAADADRRSIFVYDKNEHEKTVIDVSKDLKAIGSMVIDKKRKRLVIPDIRGHKILIYDLSGKLLSTFGSRGLDNGLLSFPTAVAIDGEGNYLVSDQMNARVQRFTPDGKFISKFGERGDGPGELALPKGVAVDAENHVYVTDGKNHKIVIFDLTGRYLMDL